MRILIQRLSAVLKVATLAACYVLFWLVDSQLIAQQSAAQQLAVETNSPAALGPESAHDSRCGPLAGEIGDFLLTPSASMEGWNERKQRVRQIMQVALGLWPAPTRTPLNAVVRGKLDFGDYTIEKVTFESLPGFFVTGSLYRPIGTFDRRPAVLSPHGHFPGGRFQDNGANTVAWQIANGAERFEDGGRSFMQSRHVQLARMGCVVFHYDMVGYADSIQLPMDLVHRFSAARQAQTTAPKAGFYSAAAELRLQNVMGLHTYNSQRALDFVASLPDVDPQRIAVTGGSGGGTQTFMLCAVDDRPLVSVPVVIVSADRQGGCTCENICGLRIGTNNLDFTALHAPKPLLLISADDDSRTMPERGFPELRAHYRLLGGEAMLEHVPLLHFPHNYNYVSRTAMYHFMNKHLHLGLEEPILESPYRRLTRQDLSVWDEEHPPPPSGREFELKLLDYLSQDADQQLSELVPTDPDSLARYRDVVGTAWDILLRKLPQNSEPRPSLAATVQRDDCRVTRGAIEYRTLEGHRAQLPFVRLEPVSAPNTTVMLIGEQGKSAVMDNQGHISEEASKLLAGGANVVGVDLLNQGDSSCEPPPSERQPFLSGEQAHCGWTYCYNQPVFAKRVHDLLATIAVLSDRQSVFARETGQRKLPLEILARGSAAVWAAAAIAQSDGAVDHAALDTQGFRFTSLSDVYDINFVPGAVKYGDVPGLLSLAGPTRLTLAGEPVVPRITSAAYRAGGLEEPTLVAPQDLLDKLIAGMLGRQ